MELKQQFKDFLREIRPTDKQQEGWRTGSQTLRSRLNAYDPLKDIIVTTFLQGSVRRSTAVRPLGDKRPDVDIVVVTNLDAEKELPTEAMKRFVGFLDQYYFGKWRPQGRSFGIELSYVDLDLVITALPPSELNNPDRRRALEDFYRTEAVNTVNTLEEDTSWRLNPAWKTRATFDELNQRLPSSLSELLATQVLDEAGPAGWKESPLLLPDRETQKWGETHPLRQISWTAEKNRLCNLSYLDVVRAVKWWRVEKAEKLPKYPKGYPLEHMVGYILNNGQSSVAAGLTQFFEDCHAKWLPLARRNEVPFLSDHGVPSHNVLARLSDRDFQAFVEIIGDIAKVAREALEEGDAQKSGKLWQSIFGSRFPLPGPQGGDRVLGSFTRPGEPTTAPATKRFA